MLDRMLLDMVHQHAGAIDARVSHQHIQNHSCPLILVLQMGRVYQNLLFVFHGQVDVFHENRRFVPCILVQANFTDTQNVFAFQEFGDHRDHFARERDVFGFLGVDA